MRANKLFSKLLTAAIFLTLLFVTAPAALAATHAPSDLGNVQNAIDGAGNGDVIDLSRITGISPSPSVTINVGDNKTLTIKGNSSTTFEYISFVFGSNNSITIENLNIKSAHNHVDSSGNAGLSPLHFSGTDNTLTLVGSNTITSGQTSATANYGAAVGVPENAALTINGTGSLTAQGGYCGAGIGGGYKGGGGTITITGGNITAKGGGYGAGIGGGADGDGGDIDISGGNITAQGGYCGAGIGGGAGGGGGDITITGGEGAVSISTPIKQQNEPRQ